MASVIPDDAGEKWLIENDPDYDSSAAREIPWGMSQDIERLVERSSGPYRFHGTKAHVIVSVESRACWWCEQMYVPNTKWQKFCTVNCRTGAFKARKRATHLDKK